jgi:putative ABC transport system permease protein
MIPIGYLIRDLLTEKTRLILTILAITWGSFTITSMLAVGEGLRMTFIKAVENAGQNILTVQGGTTSKNFKGIRANQPIRLTFKDMKSIRSLPNIKRISPNYTFSSTLQYGTQKVRQNVQAVNAKFAKIHQIPIQENGRFLSSIDIEQHRYVIVLGPKTANELFDQLENPIGKKIYLSQRLFTVIGLMEDKPQIVATQSPDIYLNWIPFTTYQTLNNPLSIPSLSITYRSEKKLATLKTHIQKVIAINHAADPSDNAIVNFSDIANQQAKITTFFIGMQIFLGIIGGLTLLVAAAGIANVMYAAVNRATHEIGIRMAIGARTYQILSYYLLEAFLTTLTGGIIGIFFSGLLVYGIQHIPMRGRLIESLGRPEPVLSVFVIVIVIFVLGLTSFLAGLFPALKASRIDPAEALSYE